MDKIEQFYLRERQGLELRLGFGSSFNLGIVDGGRDDGHGWVDFRCKLGLEISHSLGFCQRNHFVKLSKSCYLRVVASACKEYPVVTVLGFSVNVVTGFTMVFVVTYVVGFSPILVFVAMTTNESVSVLK
jgi:hypothetical protein